MTMMGVGLGLKNFQTWIWDRVKSMPGDFGEFTVNIGLVMNSYDTLSFKVNQIWCNQSDVNSRKNIRPKLHFNEFHSKSNIITQVPGLPLHLQPLQPPQQLPHQPKQQV